ncbi:helix-turn-helix transcriptional regulator [Salinarchaeum laminariae]|uniref:helix-turn-helix transcriptional regulator n=1 Tax=Salinarchaeum laminariae TaxID=869888 RepID=UPI0020BE52A7|nr:MarR family transcriptional regulator [Salinarchaeum laminariae]
MDPPALRGKRLVAAVAFVAATLVLAVQLINPTPVVVSVGENGAQTDELGQYFTYSDVGTIVAASVLAGASGAYLLVSPASERRGQRSERTSATGSDAVPSPMGSRNTAVGDGSGSHGAPAQRSPDPAAWESTLDGLQGNQAAVYGAVVEAEGKLPQRDVVEETDLSKATVSRTLDALERKQLLERKRRGMGNVVVLT